MKNAKVLEPSDIKKILAEHFGVPEERIIKTQYTYIILEENEDEKN